MENEINQTSIELPLYQCHKKVRALKIAAIKFEKDGSATITPNLKTYAAFSVDKDYVQKHIIRTDPDVVLGGYYVVYEDGYKSFSPAVAFENGYVRI